MLSFYPSSIACMAGASLGVSLGPFFNRHDYGAFYRLIHR